MKTIIVKQYDDIHYLLIRILQIKNENIEIQYKGNNLIKIIKR